MAYGKENKIYIVGVSWMCNADMKPQLIRKDVERWSYVCVKEEV